MPEPGGALGWGIPSYRLAAAALKEEIARIVGLGVRIHCGSSVFGRVPGRGRATHDAVFLMCGHGRGGRLQVPGESAGTVKDGLAFLQRVREGNAPVLEGKVAVIGGGNTAVDVARCAVRLGAKAVIVYQQRRQEMPAFENEIKMALEEGVELLELVSPVRIDAEDREVVLTLQHMKVLDGDAPQEMHLHSCSGSNGNAAGEPTFQGCRPGSRRGLDESPRKRGRTPDFAPYANAPDGSRISHGLWG